MKEMYPATALMIVCLIMMALPIALNFFTPTTHQLNVIMIALGIVIAGILIWWEVAVWKNRKL